MYKINTELNCGTNLNAPLANQVLIFHQKKMQFFLTIKPPKCKTTQPKKWKEIPLHYSAQLKKINVLLSPYLMLGRQAFLTPAN